MSKSLARMANEAERRFDAGAGPVSVGEFFVTVYRDRRDGDRLYFRAGKSGPPQLETGWNEVFTVSGEETPKKVFDKARRECEKQELHVPGLTMVQSR